MKENNNSFSIAQSRCTSNIHIDFVKDGKLISKLKQKLSNVKF